MLASYLKSLRATFVIVLYLGLSLSAYAQSGGSSTSVTGTVADPTGAVVANATVEIHNPVSGFERTTITDSAGRFTISKVSFYPYPLTVPCTGFCGLGHDMSV